MRKAPCSDQRRNKLTMRLRLTNIEDKTVLERLQWGEEAEEEEAYTSYPFVVSLGNLNKDPELLAHALPTTNKS